jgi:hypothetical protein
MKKDEDFYKIWAKYCEELTERLNDNIFKMINGEMSINEVLNFEIDIDNIKNQN